MRKFIVIVVISLFMGGSAPRPVIEKKQVVILRSYDVTGKEVLMQVR